MCRFPFFSIPLGRKKKTLLANKYCDEDQVVREDIYKVLLNEVLKKLNGITLSEVVAKLGGIDTVLTFDLFNKAYIDVSHLTLCEIKQQRLVVPVSTRKGKKQKKNVLRREKKHERCSESNEFIDGKKHLRLFIDF